MLARSACFALVLALVWATHAPVTHADDGVQWRDTARDVYVDGTLDPGARVWTSAEPSRLAIQLSRAETVWIVNRETETVEQLPAAGLQPEAGGGATSAAPAAAAGDFARIQGARFAIDVLTLDQQSLVVTAHRGHVGPIDRETLWRQWPSWKRRADAFEPTADTLKALRAVDRDVELTVAFGTWCGDSRAQVPRLLRALELADNPRLQVELVALDNGFLEPAALIRDAGLTNVPTVLVRDPAGELGRLVETPIRASLDADLVALLAGSLEPHPGAMKRDRLIAEGRYRHRAGHGDQAHESWRLWSVEPDRQLLHCRIQHGSGRVTESFQRFAADGRTQFLEVTRTAPDGTSRTRLWIDDEGQASATTRGNASGIVRQQLTIDAHERTLGPCTAAIGLAAAAGAHGTAMQTLAGIRVPATTGVAAVRFATAAHAGDVARHPSPLGPRSARQLEITDGPEQGTWWLDDHLAIPLAHRALDRTVVLESLRLETTGTAAADHDAGM